MQGLAKKGEIVVRKNGGKTNLADVMTKVMGLDETLCKLAAVGFFAGGASGPGRQAGPGGGVDINSLSSVGRPKDL